MWIVAWPRATNVFAIYVLYGKYRAKEWRRVAAKLGNQHAEHEGEDSNINTTVADRISFPLDSGKAKSQGIEDKNSRMDTIKADISSGVYLNTDGNNIIQQAL